MGKKGRNKGFSRRSLLKGFLAGGAMVSVGLPALEIFLNGHGTAYADGGGFPARFGMFFWGNGMLPHRWVPEGEGAEWTLSDQLQPLASIKDVLTVVTGMSVRTGNDYPHTSGIAGLLTGTAPLPDPLDELGGKVQAMSIDQIIANEIGSTTRFKSLEFGSDPGEGESWNGLDSRNPPERDPYLLFERIFGAGFRAPGEEPIIDPTVALRRSVLDAVMEDSRRLNGVLGANDRRRLDQHLDGIRALELRLARLEDDPPDLASCRRPGESEVPLSEYPDLDGRRQMVARNRAMCDVVALALACDQTRVFSNFYSRPLSSVLYPGASDGHHRLTHDEPGDQPQVHEIVLKIMEEYRYMAEALRAIPEGDETLLDHCVLYGGSEISLGRNHSLDEMPILLAGSACGRLRSDLHYRSFSGENTSKVMLSLVRAMGINAPHFGNGVGRSTEGLSAIEV